MKLEDWLLKQIEDEAKLLSVSTTNRPSTQILRTILEPPAGLHVIGTCGDCKDWEQMESCGWGRCHHEQKDADISKQTIGYDFGCIHFDKKEP